MLQYECSEYLQIMVHYVVTVLIWIMLYLFSIVTIYTVRSSTMLLTAPRLCDQNPHCLILQNSCVLDFKMVRVLVAFLVIGFLAFHHRTVHKTPTILKSKTHVIQSHFTQMKHWYHRHLNLLDMNLFSKPLSHSNYHGI